MKEKILSVLYSYGRTININEFPHIAFLIEERLQYNDIEDVFMNFVCGFFKTTKDEIRSKSRKEHIVNARHCFVSFCIDYYGEKEINHSAIMRIVNRKPCSYYWIKFRKDTEPYFQNIYKDCYLKFRENEKS